MKAETIKLRAVPGRKGSGKFSGKDVCRFRHGEGWVRPCPSSDSARVNACPLHARTGSRAPEGAEANPAASSDQNRGLLRAARGVLPRFIALVLEHEFNGRRQTFETLFPRLALTVGLGHFGAEGNQPFPVTLDDGRVAVSHGRRLRRLLAPGNLAFPSNPVRPGQWRHDSIEKSQEAGQQSELLTGVSLSITNAAPTGEKK